MKKTAILVMTAATMVTTSLGFAAPLSDYSAGKTSVDLTWRQSSLDANSQGATDALSKKGNMEFGITTGLGNNFALQYTNANSKSKDTDLPDGAGGTYRENGSLKMQEFNVLYKLDKNVSAYVGMVNLKGTINDEGSGTASGSKNKLQFGVMGSTKLADKTTAYAQVGVASSFTNWKIGISQEVAPNLELSIDYRRTQAKKMSFDNGLGDVDMTAKGIGVGLSYKF
jgi:predicted porin